MSSNYPTPTSPCYVATALIVNESGGVGIGQEPSFQETGLVVNGNLRLGANGNMYSSNLFLQGGTINGIKVTDWIRNVEGYQYAPSQWIVKDTNYPYTPDKWIQKDPIYAYLPGQWVNRNEYSYTPQQWIKNVSGYPYSPQAWVNRNEYNYTPNDWVKRTESNYTPDDWIKKSDLVKIIGVYDYDFLDYYNWWGLVYHHTDWYGRFKFKVNDLLSYMGRPKIQFRLRVAFSSGDSTDQSLTTQYINPAGFNSSTRQYQQYYGFFNIIYDEKESNWLNNGKNFFKVSTENPSTNNWDVDVSWDDYGTIFIIISLVSSDTFSMPKFLNVNIS
jgi:hypothetical protein